MTIESVLCYGITNCFNSLTVKSSAEISSLVRAAGKIMGIMSSSNPQDLFELAIIRQANAILSYRAHVLKCECVLLNSDKTGFTCVGTIDTNMHLFLNSQK